MNTDLSKCLAPANADMYIFFLEHTGYSRVTDRGQPLGTHSLINFYLEDEGEVESVLKELSVRRELDKRVIVMGVRGKW